MVEDASADNLKADDLSALLEDIDRCGRHRAWEDAAYVCVVPSGRCEEDYFVGVGVEDGCDYCYIWEMSAKVYIS